MSIAHGSFSGNIATYIKDLKWRLKENVIYTYTGRIVHSAQC